MANSKYKIKMDDIFKVEGSKELETKRDMFMSCTVTYLVGYI